jgi:anti-sigma factor RsiW
MSSSLEQCPGEDIAAYLDGELGAAEIERFEGHLNECEACTSDLREQRKFLCELDVALTLQPAPALPGNFVEVVAINAQADMSGMRSASERVLALRICLGLILASVLLFGSSLGEFVLGFAKPVISVGDFALQTLYGIGAGAAIIFRSVGGHMLLGSSFMGALLVVIFAAAVTLLPALISRYHRTES